MGDYSDYTLLAGLAVWGIIIIGAGYGFIRWIFANWKEGEPHPHEDNE